MPSLFKSLAASQGTLAPREASHYVLNSQLYIDFTHTHIKKERIYFKDILRKMTCFKNYKIYEYIF